MRLVFISKRDISFQVQVFDKFNRRRPTGDKHRLRVPLGCIWLISESEFMPVFKGVYLRGLSLLTNEESGQVSVDSKRAVSGWKLDAFYCGEDFYGGKNSSR